jgi:hypothetical protein
VRLNSVELEHFRIKTPDGTERIKFDYEILQTLASQQGTLLFKATSDGKVIGKADLFFWRPDLQLGLYCKAFANIGLVFSLGAVYETAPRPGIMEPLSFPCI